MNNLEYFTSYVMIIMLILLGIPLIPYLISIYLDRKGGGDSGSSGSDDNHEHLISDYDSKSKPLVIFNTLNEIYLFCTYILFRRVKICDTDTNADDIKHYNKHLSEVNRTAKLVKRNLDGTIKKIEELKKTAMESIIRNRKERENKEHADYIENMKEYNANARHSIDNTRKWFIIFIDNIKSFLVVVGEIVAFAVRIVVEVGRLIMPAIAALLRNPVFVGFLILIGFIYYILGLIKESIEKADKEKAAAAKSKDDEDKKDENTYYSIFKDIIDTFKYFLNMLNNFKMSSTGLFGNDTGKNEAGQIDRETIAGKSYDNLSYLMLSDVFNRDEFKQYFDISTELESNKYYNVLIPEKRFEVATDMHKFNNKWKVSDRKNNNGSNEKVWRLDCSKIDNVIKKDRDGNVITNGFITAFIEDGDKCSINRKALDEYENSLKPVRRRSKEDDLSTVNIKGDN